jgi:multidrug resistance protein, MATE family
MSMKKSSTHKKFISYAAINICANISVPLVGLVDAALLGHLKTLAPLAGVALATLIFDYIYFTCGFLRMATVGKIAKHMGEKDFINISRILLRSLFLALLIGIVLFLSKSALWALSSLILSGSKEILKESEIYFNIRILSAPFALSLFVINGYLLGRQKLKQLIFITLFLNLTNIFLDYIFIYKLSLNTSGAAYATFASESITFMIGITIVLLDLKSLNVLKIEKNFFNFKHFKSLIQYQANIMIRSFVLLTGFFLFNNFSSSFGILTLTTNSILLKFITFASYLIDGLAYALESFVGYALGEKNFDKIRSYFKLAIILNLVCIISYLIILELGHHRFFGFMTSHEELLQGVVENRYYLYFSLFFASFAYIYDGFYVGLNLSESMRDTMIVSFLIGFLPLAILSSYLQNPNLLWISFILFKMMRWLSMQFVLRQNLSKLKIIL